MTRYRVTAMLRGKRSYSTGYGRQPVAAVGVYTVKADASDSAAVRVAELLERSGVLYDQLITTEEEAQ